MAAAYTALRGCVKSTGEPDPQWTHPERNSGRVAGARTAVAADRRAAVPGQQSAPQCRSGTAAGSPWRSQRKRQIDAPPDRDDGRRRTAGAEWRPRGRTQADLRGRMQVNSGRSSTSCHIAKKGKRSGSAPPKGSCSGRRSLKRKRSGAARTPRKGKCTPPPEPLENGRVRVALPRREALGWRSPSVQAALP